MIRLKQNLKNKISYMGFFDKIFSGSSVSVLTAKPTINDEKEAFLTIVVASACADSDIEGEEWDTIYDTLFQKELFRDVLDLNALLEESRNNVKMYTSLAEAVTACAKLIQPENRNMLFAVCVDLVLIDGKITTNEQAIIEHLKTELKVSDELATKIVEVMLVRNYGNA